jgi:hypothetical protein
MLIHRVFLCRLRAQDLQQVQYCLGNVVQNFFGYLKYNTYFCTSIKQNSMGNKNSKNEPVNLFDRSEKVFVKFQLSENKDKWQRWMSKTKKKWVLTHESLSLEEVMCFQERLISTNYDNLFKIITGKK